MADKLGIGAVFPTIEIPLTGGGAITLPNSDGAKYQVILFYRGHW